MWTLPRLLFGHNQHSMSVRADDPRTADQALDIHMLMPMKHKFWLRSLNVLIERGKSQMHVVFAIVHQTRRIMGHEDVNGRKAREQSLHLSIFEKVISSWLVFPRTAEAAELHAAKLEDGQM